MNGIPWSEEDTQTLLKMHEEDASPQEVAAVLEISPTRVYEKCRRLGIVMRHHNEWTAKELAKLHEMYGEGKSPDQIAAKIGRTSNAVRSKARTEGLVFFEAGQRVCRRWSKADEKRLKELLYKTGSVEETALELGRTAGSIRVKMSLLNISLKDAKRHQSRGS